MVYCTRCGTLNVDDASVCTNCGAPLKTTKAQTSPYHRNWRWENWGQHHEYNRRRGAFAVFAVGMIIILIGVSAFLSQVHGIDIPWWPIILLFAGIIVIVSGIRARRRWRRCC